MNKPISERHAPTEGNMNSGEFCEGCGHDLATTTDDGSNALCEGCAETCSRAFDAWWDGIGLVNRTLPGTPSTFKMRQRDAYEAGQAAVSASPLPVAPLDSGLREALRRACDLLEASARFILKNRLDEYTVHYDEAECDGYCLRQDIQVAIDDIRATELLKPTAEKEDSHA